MISSLRTHRVLGVAISERAIHLAEFSYSGGIQRLVRSHALNFPEGLSWNDPAAVGRALRDVIRGERWSVAHAIVGLPSRWVMVVPQSLPPLVPAAATDALNLMIERDYPGDSHEWCFDYAGTVTQESKSNVLLTATAKARLTAVQSALAEAGVRAERITSTTMALASQDRSVGATQATIELTTDGATLAISSTGRLTNVERLTGTFSTSAPDGIELFAAQAQRVLSGPMSSDQAPASRLVIWDSTDADPAELMALGQRLGFKTEVNPGLEAYFSGDQRDPKTAPAGEFAGAIALARSGLERRTDDSINFLHSKLAPVARNGATRLRVAGIVAAAALLSAAVYFGVDWYVELGEVAQMQADLTSMKDDVAAARAIVERTRAAEGWFDDRPPMLGCLRDLTQAFPSQGQVIATSLTLRDDRTGTLGGRAQSQEGAFDLLDRLTASGRFSQVKMVYVRQADRSGPGVAFALTFVHSGGE